MRSRVVEEFLRQARVPYTTFRHPAAFTALDVAQASHVPGRSWAKVVVCIADEQPILAVVPAPCVVDLEALRLLAGASALRLARESEFAALYPDCEPGAMPPFGSLYRQPVFLDQSLVGDPEMAFHAGTHSDAIRMDARDFVEVTRPVVGLFGRLRTATRHDAGRQDPMG